MLQVIILFCSITSLLASDCKPIEENTPYSLLKRWRPTQHDRSKVALEKDGVIYATCDTDMTCVNYYDHIANTQITSFSDGSYLINHTIYNATRREVGNWVLKYVEGLQNDKSVVSRCYLKSYVNYHKVHCEKQLTETSLSINCKAVRVFPQARCQFLVIQNETIQINVSDVIYDHEATGDGGYFNSKCQLHLLHQSILTGTYSATVTMFPNITGDDRDVQYGASTTTHFDKDGSSQLSVQQCKETLGVETLDKSKVCLVKSQESSETPHSSYLNEAPNQPAVVEDRENINGRCDIDTIDSEIVVNCNFVHMFHERFRCQFFLMKKEEEYLIINGSLKTIELVSDTASKYLTDCTFLVSGSYIEPGLYEATVTASEHDGKISTGKNMSIYFDLDVNDTRLKNETLASVEYIKVYHLFIPAVAGIIIAIVLFLLAFKYKKYLKEFLCRRKPNSKVDHIYQDIDCNQTSLVNSCETGYINGNKINGIKSRPLLEQV